jgi:putative transposase
MAPPPIAIRLKAGDLAEIRSLLRGGVQQVRVVLRALALSHLAAGVAAPQVAHSVPLTAKAIRELAHRYSSGGLDRALYDKQRPGASQILDASQKQRIVAMVCSQPPEGRARWTVRLVAKEAISRKLVPRVGRETIRVLLESHDLKPWREKNVVRGRVDPAVHSHDGGRAGAVREAL